jgi:ABC-2 type transport system permease protein
MRCFAEETKTGTLELLITQPISIFKIILSKYLAASFLAVLTILPTLIYYISVYQMGEITGNIDHPSTIGGYLGLLLLSITYVAIGILASSLSKNQVIGFLLGLFFNFIIYVGFSYLAVFVGDPLDYYLMNLSMLDHFTALQRGIIDSRDIAYFLSVIFFTLYLTKIVLKKK